MRLHEWIFPLAAWRQPHGEDGGEVNGCSAIVEEARGWWGDDPPFHMPVFILTHHAREPVRKAGGTTFTFVTDGIDSAIEQARETAGGQDVVLGGGANLAQQYLKAGLIDELELHVVPVLPGNGTRLFDNLGGGNVGLECVRVVENPGVTHLKDRVAR